MLQDKLERESRDSRRRQFRFAGALAGSGLLVAAFGILAANPGLFDRTEDAGSVRPGDAALPASPAPLPSAASPAPLPSAASPAPLPSAASPAPRNSPARIPDIAARERFKDDLATFQAELEPGIAAADFERWNGLAQNRILADKDAAIAQFGAGAYGDAVNTLAAAAATAKRELAARDAAFTEAMAGARTAFEADDHAGASLRIAQALEIAPDSPDALALNQRIRNLTAVLAEIDKAAIARVGNNLRDEAKHLSAALKIDPSRAALRKRLATVRGELRERNFAGRIDRGLADLRGRDLDGARRNLAAARAIFPDRDETALLADGVARLDRELQIKALVDKARRVEAADDWRAAADLWIKAAGLAPNDGEISDALAHARALGEVRRQVERHLAASDRLASETVAAEVDALLARADALGGASPALARRAAELAALVASYGVKVPVRVISDGLTNITVRGVGVVGATTDRTIELRPGRYTFEGIRPGYRAKLVRVDIRPGAGDLVLEIIPDEPI